MRKKRYINESFVKRKAEELEKINGVKLRYYTCPVCTYFHLTKKVFNHPRSGSKPTRSRWKARSN